MFGATTRRGRAAKQAAAANPQLERREPADIPAGAALIENAPPGGIEPGYMHAVRIKRQSMGAMEWAPAYASIPIFTYAGDGFPVFPGPAPGLLWDRYSLATVGWANGEPMDYPGTNALEPNFYRESDYE